MDPSAAVAMKATTTTVLSAGVVEIHRHPTGATAGVVEIQRQTLPRFTDRTTAFALLVSGESLFVPDISAAPDKWAGSGVGYNTFISCPIASTEVSYGLLTLDAQNTDDLVEEDVTDIRLLAGILANAFAERVRAN